MSFLLEIRKEFWSKLAKPESFEQFQADIRALNREFEVIKNPADDVLCEIAAAFTDARTHLLKLHTASTLSNEDNTIYNQLRERISSLGNGVIHQAAVEAIQLFQWTFPEVVIRDPFSEDALHPQAPAQPGQPKKNIQPNKIVDGTAIFENVQLQDVVQYIKLHPDITKYRFEGCDSSGLQLDCTNVTHLTLIDFKGRSLPFHTTINLQELILENNQLLETLMTSPNSGNQKPPQLKRVVLRNNSKLTHIFLFSLPGTSVKIDNCPQITEESIKAMIRSRVNVEYSKPSLKKTWNVSGWLQGLLGMVALGGIGLFFYNLFGRRSGKAI